MDEKLSQEGLANYLVDKHSMTQEDAQQFVKTFFELIEEELLNEGAVKVKGLGVFKKAAMESRDCISVNNGERIQIDGYNKIVFTPEASVRELINKPFAHFESVILKDSTVFDDMTETEIEEQATEFCDEENEADSDNEYKAEDETEETVSEPGNDCEIQDESEELTESKEHNAPEELTESNEPTESEEQVESEEHNAPEEQNESNEPTESEEQAESEEHNALEELTDPEKLTESEKPTESEESEEQTGLKPEQPEQTEQRTCEVQTEDKGQPECAEQPEHEPDKDSKPEDVPSEQESEPEPIAASENALQASSADVMEQESAHPVEGINAPDKKQPQTGNWALSMLISVIIFLSGCGAVLIYLYSDAFYPTEDEQGVPTELKVTEPENQAEETAALPQPALTPDSVRSTSASNNAAEEIKDTNPALETAVKPQSGTQQTEQTGIVRKPVSSDAGTDTATYTITGLKTTHKLVSGNTLRRLALKYYGTKALWTYIVQYNKDIIKDPDNIPIGTVLKIPELKKE